MTSMLILVRKYSKKIIDMFLQETPELKEEESDEFLESIFNDIPKEEKERIEKRVQHQIYQTYQSIQLFKQKVEAQKNETQKKLRSYNPNGELDLDQILKDR